MYLLTFEEWITTVVVRALGWTFTHSLWQALVALLVAYAMLAVMKKARASSRYNLLIGISLLFITAVIATFFFQLRQHEAGTQLSDNNSSLPRIFYNENSAATPVILESKRILDVVLNYFNQYLYILVTSWFIIFCLKWLRLSLNLNYVNRISRFESAPVNAEWQQLNDRLKDRLGISRDVKLMHSNIVKVPLVSGIFRPLILVPAGMLSNMPVDVIESILLHELGHIRRNDYLVNIIQSAAETIFFFNPFFIKLSALIREEREACCDSIALNVTNNKVSYVQALVTFGEYSSTSGPLLAFAGSRNHLLQRIKRILYNQNKKPGIMEKSILFGSVIMLSVITAFTTIKNEKKPAAPVIQEIKTYVSDTVPENVNENENTGEKEPTRVETRKRKKKMREAEQKMEKKQRELEAVQQKMEEIQIHIDNDIQVKNEILQKKMIELQTRINFQNEKLQARQEFQLKQAQKVMANIDMQKIKHDVQKALKAVDMEKINGEIQATTLKAMEQRKQIAALAYGKRYMNDDIASILEFLEENNVADADDVKSFTLNNDELIVNDKKQDATLHQQLKERYIKGKDDRILYSNSNGTKSITITRNDPS
jgi:bla regulator protein blaR1